MRGINVPPITRLSILSLTFCSLLVFILRLNTYYKLLAIAQAPQIQPENDDRPVPKPALPIYEDIIVPYITLIPSLSLFYPWVLLTTTFVETTITGFFSTGATLFYGGKYCERVWSSKELARFLVIVSVVTNIIAWITAITEYSLASAIPASSNKSSDSSVSSNVASVGKEFYLLQPINGGIAYQLAFLVALKQLVPEHSIVLFRGLFTMKVKHLAMPALILYTLIGVAYFRDIPFVSQVWTGFFSSWIYLRFYRYTYVDPILPRTSNDTNPGAGSSSATTTAPGQGVSMKASPGKTRIRGDASEVFSLSNFFYPTLVRDLVQSISTVVFSTLVTFKVCTPFGQDEVEQSNLRASIRTSGASHGGSGSSGSGGASIVGGKSIAEIEADRRRALALKALEEKLNNNNKNSAGSSSSS